MGYETLLTIIGYRCKTCGKLRVCCSELLSSNASYFATENGNVTILKKYCLSAFFWAGDWFFYYFD